jgi:hypothetical protein
VSTDDDQVARWYKRKLLEDLSKNPKQPVLAEMAREMLAGRLTTQQAMASDAYMEALGAAARPGMAKYREMSDDELAAAGREGRAAVEQLMAAEEQREAAETRARARRGHDPVEEEPTGSIMVRAARGPAGPGPETSDPGLPRSVRDRAGRRR